MKEVLLRFKSWLWKQLSIPLLRRVDAFHTSIYIAEKICSGQWTVIYTQANLKVILEEHLLQKYPNKISADQSLQILNLAIFISQNHSDYFEDKEKVLDSKKKYAESQNIARENFVKNASEYDKGSARSLMSINKDVFKTEAIALGKVFDRSQPRINFRRNYKNPPDYDSLSSEYLNGFIE